MNNLAIQQNTTREQARAHLSEKTDDELLRAYKATKCLDDNILTADAVHILLKFYLEFELNDRGLPTRSSIKIGW